MTAGIVVAFWVVIIGMVVLIYTVPLVAALIVFAVVAVAVSMCVAGLVSEIRDPEDINQ